MGMTMILAGFVGRELGFFHSWGFLNHFLHRSRRSQIGGVFSQLEFSQLAFPPPISALSDRGSIFVAGIFHSWDILH